jgi:uncharacterized protein (DUF697 family)
MSTMRFAATALGMSAGIIVWALHFGAIYGATAVACARGLPQFVAPAVGWSTVAASAALAVVIARGWRRRHDFAHWLGAALAALALIAVLWEAVPVLLVRPPCG